MTDQVQIFWEPEWQARVDLDNAIREARERLEVARAQLEASSVESMMRALSVNRPMFTYRFGEAPSRRTP